MDRLILISLVALALLLMVGMGCDIVMGKQQQTFCGIKALNKFNNKEEK